MDALYAVVRNLDYTWEDVLTEKVPRTLFTIDKLAEEKEQREEEVPDDVDQGNSTTMNNPN